MRTETIGSQPVETYDSEVDAAHVIVPEKKKIVDRSSAKRRASMHVELVKNKKAHGGSQVKSAMKNGQKDRVMPQMSREMLDGAPIVKEEEASISQGVGNQNYTP